MLETVNYFLNLIDRILVYHPGLDGTWRGDVLRLTLAHLARRQREEIERAANIAAFRRKYGIRHRPRPLAEIALLLLAVNLYTWAGLCVLIALRAYEQIQVPDSALLPVFLCSLGGLVLTVIFVCYKRRRS
jgi:hypothetical protein